MKKIFVNTPYSKDANSFWRCMGPLSYMAKQSQGEVEIYLPPDGLSIAWDRLDQFDAIFMHRPCRQQDVTLLRLARALNIPVWSDYDDWLFHIPSWNAATGIYHQHAVQEAMALVIACSDVVTVSTTALFDSFKKLNDQTVILPNAYRSDLFPYRSKQTPTRTPTYLWRGTNTHDGDLMSVESAFPRLTSKTYFLGDPAYSVLSKMSASLSERVPHVDPLIYWKSIYQRAPKVWLFPLLDCFFNQCKSNISWIEATHAGAITVAPAMPEWRHPGVINYEPGDADSFFKAAEDVMNLDADRHTQIVSDAYDYMREKFDIKVINQFRSSLFQSLFHPDFKRNTRDAFNQMTGTWALSVLKGEPLERVTA